jgi:hypothetical protein
MDGDGALTIVATNLSGELSVELWRLPSAALWLTEVPTADASCPDDPTPAAPPTAESIKPR